MASMKNEVPKVLSYQETLVQYLFSESTDFLLLQDIMSKILLIKSSFIASYILYNTTLVKASINIETIDSKVGKALLQNHKKSAGKFSNVSMDMKILRQIGAGNFGIVFLATTQDQTQVAIKVDPEKKIVLWELEVHNMVQLMILQCV
jgi:hypothetical protein